MVDFLGRPLHAVRKPADDMLGVIRVDAMKMIEPWLNPLRIAESDIRRAIQVEYSAAGLHDPSALRDQPILDQHRLPRRPRHLLDMAILIEPVARGDALDKPKAGFDAISRP